MRVKVDWRSDQVINYKDFCKQHPLIKLTLEEWKNIIYTFNNSFREYILETGDKAILPGGLGKFSINKKKRKSIKIHNGVSKVGLPIDWVKTRQKGKYIYNFNYDTEGYYFGWIWFKRSTRFRFADLWRFKPTRTTSRLLAHYIKVDNKYQHQYREWLKL